MEGIHPGVGGEKGFVYRKFKNSRTDEEAVCFLLSLQTCDSRQR